MAFVGSTAQASLSIAPVRIHFTSKDRVVTVTLNNTSPREVTVQTETFRWSQGADGADVLTPTDDVIVSPPILKLPPSSRKSFRLARLQHNIPEEQLSYRLFIHELPSADADSTHQLSVQFSVTFSVPIFVTPRASSRDLRCRPTPGTASLDCENAGNTFVQIREASLVQAEQTITSGARGEYLLPGTRKKMPLAALPSTATGPARLMIQLEDGTTQAMDVVLP